MDNPTKGELKIGIKKKKNLKQVAIKWNKSCTKVYFLKVIKNI